MDNMKKTTHESYGKLEISRVTGGDRNLFGSSISHRNTVTLRIHRAEHQRDLSSDWYFDRGLPIVEIEMSQTQFAEAITSMNMGSGTPVTIKYVDGVKMEECPHTDKIQEFDDEFEERLRKLSSDMAKLTDRTKEIMNQKKAINKSEREEVLFELGQLEQELGSNLSFISKMFSEQMDRTVLESKGEVEGFILNKIHTLGMKELQNYIPEVKQIGTEGDDNIEQNVKRNPHL